VSDAYHVFSKAEWQQIRLAVEAEQKALQLKAFYRTLTEYDKRWLQGLKIGWQQKPLESQPGQG
jgi:hypothetical protein